MLIPVGSNGPLILPPSYRSKVLLPVAQSEWRSPSRALPKDQFGNDGVRTFFRLTGRLDDGAIKSVIWFDDRDAFDAFLFDMVRNAEEDVPFPRENWNLPRTIYGDPSLVPWVRWAVDAVTFLTTTGSNQTFNKPSDWDDAHNSIELVGGGASGGCSTAVSGHVTGGGGGEYGETTGFSFTGSTATYRIGSQGAAKTSTGNGNPGTDSWWNGTTQAGATLGAIHGNGGVAGSGNTSGGAGGTGGVGPTHNPGGRGGNLTGGSGTGASGGGGAGGPNGAGGNGSDSSSTANVQSAGGTGDAGVGGAGRGSGTTTDGGAGAEWTSNPGGTSAGPGGGSAGVTDGQSGKGGLYGAASGGGVFRATAGTSDAGAQGIVVVTYTPLVSILYPRLERLTRGAGRGHHTGSIH